MTGTATSGGARIASVAAKIDGTAAATEATFLRAGGALESAMGILAALEDEFARLEDGLATGAVTAAREALAGVADRLQAPAALRDGLAGLEAMGAAAARSVGRLEDELRTIGVLAVNARIAAAGISVAGSDFAAFARDIARTAAAATATIVAFSAEVAGLRQQVATARARQAALYAARMEAARTIPPRLRAALALVAGQHARAAEASRAARAQGLAVQGRIREAIAALQIGDATRQRLEHAGLALQLAEADGTGLVLRLAAAQLADTAAQHDAGVRTVTGALAELAAALGRLRRLGQETHGATDGAGRSAFLARLEQELLDARAVSAESDAARRDAAAVIAAVDGATASLRAHLRRVQSCESDLRIMGLNTSFRCARVGQAGLALGCIAQELRARSAEFARCAAGLMAEVAAMAEASAAAAGAGGPADDGAGAAVGQALATLAAADRLAGSAMAALDAQGGRIAGLLDAALAALRPLRGDGLDTVAAALDALATGLPQAGDDPAGQALAARLARSYTMARERQVHAAVLGQPAEEAAPEPEDVLF